jgi:hypothetical protein
MSKDIEMNNILQDLKIITESTHDKKVRNAVTTVVNHILRTEQGWVDEDFELNQNKDKDGK